MKHVKKIFAFALTLVMALAVALPAFAQDVSPASNAPATDKGNGTITINNASNGVEYKIYRVFNATVGENDEIAYTGSIAGLEDYFEYDETYTTNIVAKSNAIVDPNADELQLTEDAIAALEEWTVGKTPVLQATGDGTAIKFKNIAYGYYIVTTSQGDQTISVDSTKPNATINDKNDYVPVENPKKVITQVNNTEVTDEDGNAIVSANIGDTVHYKVSFGTANFDGTYKMIKYTINDDFAVDALTGIVVDEITIGSTEYKVQGEVPQFNNGNIEIPWTEGGTADGKSLYANGAEIVVKYHGTVTEESDIDGEGNTNTVTITPTTDAPADEQPEPREVTKTFYTYALAIKKVKADGTALAGAEFEIKDPNNQTIYVTGANGNYIYAGTTETNDATATLTTDSDGILIVKGVADGTYSVTETKAPNGYNKLMTAQDVTATRTGEETTSATWFIDADGNVVPESYTETKTEVTYTNNTLSAAAILVVNKTGAEMPSTGGIGTTIFYVVGGVMVAGAVVFLLTKRRMASAE